MGRPSKFKDFMIDQAKKLAEKGWTDAEIAEFFDVSLSTVSNWKVENPEFLEALKQGKDFSDRKVERSLFERATGYSHPDVHVSNFKGGITVTPVTKHYAPDTTAAIFWLKNRKPKEWRDKIEHGVEHTGSIKIIVGGDVDSAEDGE